MKRLHAKHPDLSNNEHDVRLSENEPFYQRDSTASEYLRPGVETIRYRLRKKFGLEREDSLTDYLSNYL